MSSFSSFAACPPAPVRSFHLRVSPAGTPAVPVSRAFIYINFAGFLLFGGFGAPLKRRKYKIIMIIMSHFARNNTVGAGIRRGSRAIRRVNNVGRRGSATSWCIMDPRSFLHRLFILSPFYLSLLSVFYSYLHSCRILFLGLRNFRRSVLSVFLNFSA